MGFLVLQYNFFPFSTVDSRLRVAVLGGNFLWQDVHFIGLRHAWTQKDHRGAMVLLFQLVPKAGLEPARFEGA